MSDRYCTIHFACPWAPAFQLISRALKRLHYVPTHPTDQVIYYLPIDGSDRRPFVESSDSKQEGTIQFWVRDCEDVVVTWRYTEKKVSFSVFLSSIGVPEEAEIVRALYLEIRETGYPELLYHVVMELYLD